MMSTFRMPLCAVCLVLAGCRSASRVDHLTYWCATNTFEIEFARQVVTEWNQDTTHIPVDFQPVPAGQSSEEVILAAIVGKTTPDIYSNIWPGVVEQYREAGAVIPLDQFSDFDSALASRLPPGLIEGFRSPNGQFYQFPWKGNPLMLYYNAGMLGGSGISSVPDTYEEFLSLGPRIAVDLNGDEHPDQWLLDPNILSEWWQRFFDFYTFSIAATGGETLILNNLPQLDRPETFQVMSFFRQGYSSGYFPRSIFQEDIFLKGKVAFHVSGPWMVPYLERYRTEDLHYGITTLPLPAESSEPVHTYGDPKSIVIFSTTYHPKQAWEFVKFFTSEANDRRLLEVTNQLPLRRNLVSDPYFVAYFNEHPKLRIFAEQIPYIVATDHTIYLQEIFDIISQEFDAACIHQAKPLDDAISDMQARVSTLIERESLASKAGRK
ncbi:MAG: extracellular solute-binding protein [Fidelibacterota bacterium]|nr:MAG: extracellular solute-binding protein [Candidatus Neomarinimicrobiota bacterium]